MMYEVITEVGFEAAHMVTGHPKCGKLHGHSFKMVVCVEGQKLGTNSAYDFVVDFGELKRLMKELAPDHTYLNDLYSFAPTSENLARHFYKELKKRFFVFGIGVSLKWVEVWEGYINHARSSEDHWAEDWMA